MMRNHIRAEVKILVVSSGADFFGNPVVMNLKIKIIQPGIKIVKHLSLGFQVDAAVIGQVKHLHSMVDHHVKKCG